MAKVAASHLAKALQGENFHENRDAIYLFYGSEPRRIQDAAIRLRDALAPRLGGEAGVFHYLNSGAGPEETGIGDIIAQLNTVSMFGDGKLVWLGPLGSLDKKMSEALLSYALNPNPQSTLIITLAFEKGSRRQVTTFEKSSFFNEIKDNATLVAFNTPSANELVKWVAGRIRARGLAASPEIISALIDLCDRDLSRLDSEIEKLDSFVGDTREITAQSLEVAVSDFRTNTVWDFTKAVARLDFPAAQSALASLLDNNVPAQMILKMLVTEILMAVSAADHKAGGGDFASFAKDIGKPAFTLKDAWAAREKWTPALARKGLRSVMKTSMDITGGGVSADTGLYALLSEINYLSRSGKRAYHR